MASIAVRNGAMFDRVWGRWTAAWLGGSVLGIINGTIRELTYKDRVGDLTAHYISTATLIVLLALYMWLLENRWPIPTSRSALKIGATWLVLTASFDFGFGHYVDGKAWSELAKDYDVTAGRVWILILIWIAVAPAVVCQLRLRKPLAPSGHREPPGGADGHAGTGPDGPSPHIAVGAA